MSGKKRMPMTDGYRTFLIVWGGQVVSIIGSSLTWFGISIWVFLDTGSITSLAIILLASQLPRTLLSPIAGTYVDRWDRRTSMILADAGSGAATLVMIALYLTGNLTLLSLGLIAAMSGVFQAFQMPAYQAATSLLVPKERYSQASGMIMLAEAMGNLVAPALGGIMIAIGGLGLLVAIDMVTFLIALVTLLIVRFPKPPVTKVGEASKGSVWFETKFGFLLIWNRRGLFWLLVYFATINLAFGAISPLITAYLLSITTASTMGIVFSLGATGMIAGSIVASAWRGVEHKVAAIVALGAVLGAAVGAVGVASTLPFIVLAIWVALFTVPIAGAFSQALWMRKIEPDIQGRVFAVRTAVASAAVPLSLILVGPLADRVFVPLMTGTSTLGLWLQGFFGTGLASAYGLFFVSVGLFVVASSMVAWSVGALRHLERDIPDAAGLPTEIDEEVVEATVQHEPQV